MVQSVADTGKIRFTWQICAGWVEELCHGPELLCDYGPPPGRVPVRAAQRSCHTGHATVARCARASLPVSQTSALANNAPGFAVWCDSHMDASTGWTPKTTHKHRIISTWQYLIGGKNESASRRHGHISLTYT